MAEELKINDRDQAAALTDILEASALERAALAELVNAEAEKVKGMFKLEGINPDKLLELQASVNGILQSGIEMRKLIQEDLEDILMLDDEEQEKIMEVEEQISEQIEGDTKIVKKTIKKKGRVLE